MHTVSLNEMASWAWACELVSGEWMKLIIRSGLVIRCVLDRADT